MQDNATTSVAWLSVGDRTIFTHETVAVIVADRSDEANVKLARSISAWARYDSSGGKMDSAILTPYDHTDREPAVITNTTSELRRLVLHFHEIDRFENTRTRSPAQGSTRSVTAQRATQAPPQPVISARINVSVRPPSPIMSTHPTSF